MKKIFVILVLFSVMPSVLLAQKADVEPLVKAKWDQGNPFNILCPSTGGSRCLTGCVATAMAQIMHYWATDKGHRCGSAEIPSYTVKTQGVAAEGLPALECFDWDNMLLEYKGRNITGDNKTAVATLMLYAGVAVEMGYGTEVSTAYENGIPQGIVDYFGYLPGASRVDCQTDEQFGNVVYKEISEGRPVLVYGATSDMLYAHEFVIDGYRASDGKYHVNWGYNDGYKYNEWCSLDNLDMYAQYPGWANYSTSKHAIIGIQAPEDTGVESVSEKLYENGAIYNLEGRKVGSLKDNGFSTLPTGIYLINGRKVLRR